MNSDNSADNNFEKDYDIEEIDLEKLLNDEEPAIGTLNKIGQSLKKLAVSTGEGMKFLYEKGKTNQHYILPFINGLLGDKLFEEEHKHSIKMSFRINGEDVPVPALHLDRDTAGTPLDIAIFVHGLMGDENDWLPPQDENKVCFGDSLKKDFELHPLYIRYNTGKHISDNGKELAKLIEELCLTYENNINSIIMLGYSMGSLVVRSTGYYAQINNYKWIEKLKKVMLFGSPNAGSYIEKLSFATSLILRKIINIYTRIIGTIIDYRSSGIKDLRFGLMVEEDWKGYDPDNSLLIKRSLVKPVPGVKYMVISATLSESLESPISMYFGDGLVGRKSAEGNTLIIPQDPIREIGNFKVFNKMGHHELISNFDVYAEIKNWMSEEEDNN